MKSMNSKLTAITAVLTLCAGMALAQGGASEPMHHRHHGDFMGGMELPLHQLNLTDDQKAQIKQIFQTEKPNMKPLMQREHAAHMEMVQLITSGTFDQSKAAAIAGQESQTHMQIEVEHARIASQIYQLLSADQKAKGGRFNTLHRLRHDLQAVGEAVPGKDTFGRVDDSHVHSFALVGSRQNAVGRGSRSVCLLHTAFCLLIQ